MDAPEHSRRTWRQSHEWNVLLVIGIIVALGLVWLGWQVYLVQHRREMRAQIETSGGARIEDFRVVASNRFAQIRSPASDRDIPAIRRLLGDERVNLIYFLRPLTAADREAIEAFPEADVQAPNSPAVLGVP